MLPYFFLLVLIPAEVYGGSKRTIEKFSSREDLATDVPTYTENAVFVVRDELYGVKLTGRGAPVVQFHSGEAVMVSTVPPGTEVKLSALRVYGGTNYWPLGYLDERGQSKEAWISGLYVKRR